MQPLAIKAKIISIYRFRGRINLHLMLGSSSEVRPGMAGRILDGNSATPLPGGGIQITKVSGQYAIATTNLDQVGKHRWVSIDLR
jgi:hypothetical protein